MLVVRRIYRSIIKITNVIDKKPVLKAFVPSDRKKYYDRSQNYWQDIDNERDISDQVASALRVLSRIHCSGSMFYRPGSSQPISNLVREHFRETNSSLGALSKSQRIDLAFAVYRYLSRCYRLGTTLTTQANPLNDSNSDITSALIGKGQNELQATEKLEAGCLLIAHPMLNQCVLTQGVLLLIQHSELTGSMAFLG
jgi:hypothetical protein